MSAVPARALQESTKPEKVASSKQIQNRKDRRLESIEQVLAKYGYWTQDEDEEYARDQQRRLYQNTEMLLREYRFLVHNLKSIPQNVASELDVPLADLKATLKAASAIGLYDTPIPEYKADQIRRSLTKIEYLHRSLEVLRNRPATHSVSGEKQYQTLKLTYIDEPQLKEAELLEKLGMMFPDKNGSTDPISRRTYYRWREQAIEYLSQAMWGGMSPTVNAVFDLIDGAT